MCSEKKGVKSQIKVKKVRLIQDSGCSNVLALI